MDETSDDEIEDVVIVDSITEDGRLAVISSDDKTELLGELNRFVDGLREKNLFPPDDPGRRNVNATFLRDDGVKESSLGSIVFNTGV